MISPRWTIVTGASSGIGLELARLFAADGHALILVARRKGRLQKLARELTKAHGVPVEAVQLDLADENAPDDLFAWTRKKKIDVHTLVNNAGFGLRGRFDRLDAGRQNEMVQLNVAAVTNLARLFLPGMIARREGGILNIASMAAFQAGPYMAVYYATKAYVLSFSEALHEEAKPFGVKVCAFCPGPVKTEFIEVAGLEGRPRFDTAPEAAPVARAGYAAYQANRAVYIPGFFNKLGIFLERFMPRAVPRIAVRRFNAVD